MNRYILLIILNAFMSAFAQVLLKKAAIKNYSTIIRQYFNIYVILGYFIYFAVLLINIYAMRYIKISIVTTISEALPFLLSIILGHYIFNEKINNYKIAGMILVFVGIIVLTI